MSLPLTETQRLDPSAPVHLFVLDATALGGAVSYFAQEPNALGASITWQGQAYTPMPFEFEGFEWSTKGTLPRPKIRMSALSGVIGGLIRDYDDLVGATVTLKRTHARYLDAVNFAEGVNPTADPTACHPDEPWFVERKTVETADVIEFELCTPLDAQNAMIPKRRVTANICPWVFKGTECGYAGADATCTKTLAACKAKFPGASLPFGGFPGTARVR